MHYYHLCRLLSSRQSNDLPHLWFKHLKTENCNEGVGGESCLTGSFSSGSQEQHRLMRPKTIPAKSYLFSDLLEQKWGNTHTGWKCLSLKSSLPQTDLPSIWKLNNLPSPFKIQGESPPLLSSRLQGEIRQCLSILSFRRTKCPKDENNQSSSEQPT